MNPMIVVVLLFVAVIAAAIALADGPSAEREFCRAECMEHKVRCGATCERCGCGQ